MPYESPSLDNVNERDPESILLSVKKLSVRLQEKAILKELSFDVTDQKLICLLGPSGCGKTSLLRTIAGFQGINSGAIYLNQQAISTATFTLPPEKRNIGMIFQEQALFPHLTARENIEFGLSKLSRQEAKRRSSEYLELVRLEGLGDRYSHQLSGGQRQRVAIARALAPHPTLLLLDEPFSSLDGHLRQTLREDLIAVLNEKAVTGILVTHDQEEAFAIADQIGVINEGMCQQWDSPYTIYHQPANRFVASFVGLGSFLPATVIEDGKLQSVVGVLKTTHQHSWPEKKTVDILLRPDDIWPDAQSALSATVIKKTFNGATTWYELKLNDSTHIKALFPSHYDYQTNQCIGIQIRANHVVAFDRS